MQLKIYSLDGIKFEGTVSQVSLPTEAGEITVLKNHIPLITVLKKGFVKINKESFQIEGGVAEIDGGKVVVLAN